MAYLSASSLFFLIIYVACLGKIETYGTREPHPPRPPECEYELGDGGGGNSLRGGSNTENEGRHDYWDCFCHHFESCRDENGDRTDCFCHEGYECSDETNRCEFSTPAPRPPTPPDATPFPTTRFPTRFPTERGDIGPLPEEIADEAEVFLEFDDDSCGNLTDIHSNIYEDKSGAVVHFDVLNVTRRLGPKQCRFGFGARPPSSDRYSFAIYAIRAEGKVELRIPRVDEVSGGFIDVTLSSTTIANFTNTSISWPFQGVIETDIYNEINIAERDLRIAPYWWSPCGEESIYDFLVTLDVTSGRGYLRLRYLDLRIKWRQCDV